MEGKKWKTPPGELGDKKSDYTQGLSTIFQIQPHTLLVDTEQRNSLCFSSISMTYYVFKTKRSMLIVLMGIADYITSCIPSCAIICGCPSKSAPLYAFNRLCQFINPSSSGRMLFFYPPRMIGPDNPSDPVTLLRQSRIFIFPPLS